MTQQSIADITHDAVEQAERACQAAVDVTPEPYRSFLTFIRQHKRVAGTKLNPVYAAIRLPYMSVDGRVKMALDEHRSLDATLAIHTQFETESTSEQLVCKATVASSLLGTATAHARVFLHGSGVDATNPLENAETSAVGRALGFLGYGLYGTGIASAEEVLLAAAGRETEDGVGNAEGKPPSDRQRAFLRDLLERSGAAENEIEERLEHVVTSQEASTLIDQLRTKLRESAA